MFIVMGINNNYCIINGLLSGAASGPKVKTRINTFMPRGLFYLKSLERSITSLRGVWSVLIITMFY